jgi:hypothetical protein
MKSLLLATIVALGIAATPTLANQQKGFVMVTYNTHHVSIPIGIAAQVCRKSANYFAKHRTYTCTVSGHTHNKAFLNFVSKNKTY